MYLHHFKSKERFVFQIYFFITRILQVFRSHHEISLKTMREHKIVPLNVFRFRKTVIDLIMVVYRSNKTVEHSRPSCGT